MSRVSLPNRLARAVLVSVALVGCRALDDPPGTGLAELTGNDSLPASELLPVVADELQDYERAREEEETSKAPIDDAAFLLEEHYRSAGFAFARVDYEFAEEGGLPRFLVDEGPRVRLSGFEIGGVAALEEGEVRALLEQVLFASDEYYSAARVSTAVRVLARTYRERGFAEVEVEAEEPVFDAERASAVVRFLVVEGPRLLLERVDWSGAEAVPGVDAGVFPRLSSELRGQPYTPRVREELRRRAVEELRDRGFPDARTEVASVSRTEGGSVLLALRLVPGPRVRITDVRISGNEHSRGSVLRDRLGIEEGAYYRASDVREGTRRLYSMGLFSEVNVRLEPQSGEERALVVELKELSTAEFFFEPGYGSYELARLRAGVVDRNAWGTGRTVRAEGSASVRALSFLIGMTDPAFLGGEDVLDLALKYERREEPSFTFEDIGFDAGLTRRFTRAFSTRLSYELRRSDLVESEVGFAPGEEEDFDLSSVELSPVYDTRDSRLDPANGWRARMSLEVASEVLGSEVDFLRWTWSQEHYFGFGEDTVLAARGTVGVIGPFGQTASIPLQERFFLGGEGSVRSFRESELGPKDAEGDPIGGEATSLFSLELRRRLVGRFEGAIFVDTGNVVADRGDFGDFDDYGHAVGIGLRYVLPVGPIRLDFGVNPNPRDGEDDYVLHLAVGRSF